MLILDPKDITLRYLRTYFIFDFLPTMPLFLINMNMSAFMFLKLARLGKVNVLISVLGEVFTLKCCQKEHLLSNIIEFFQTTPGSRRLIVYNIYIILQGFP